MERRKPLRRSPLRAFPTEARRRATVQASRIRETAKAVSGSPPLTRTVKDAVRLRDGRCLVCGQTRDELLVVGHRYAGMGGHRFQRIEALYLTCVSDNWLAEADPSSRAEHDARGFRLRHCTDDAAQALAVPVTDYGGNRWVLHPDGSRSPAPREEAP